MFKHRSHTDNICPFVLLIVTAIANLIGNRVCLNSIGLSVGIIVHISYTFSTSRYFKC